MKHIQRYLPILIIVCLSLAAWLFGLHHYLSLDTLRSHYEWVVTYITLHPVTSITLFLTTYITVVGLSIPGATFMTLIGGLFFGQILGTCSVVVAATIGATIIFLSAKLASEDLLKKKSAFGLRKPKPDSIRMLFTIS